MRNIVFIAVFFLWACVDQLKQEKQPEDNKSIAWRVAEHAKKQKAKLLSEKIKNDPTNIALLYQRVEYNKSNNNYENPKDLESALYDLKEIVRLDSLDGNNHYQIAETYFELSKFPNANWKYPLDATHHLEKALNIDNEDYRSHALLGNLLLDYALLDSAKYKEAIKHFNTSLKIEYNQANTHLLLGYTFKQLQYEKQAINCFRNAVNVDPEFKEAYVQLGQMFHVKGDTTAVVYYDNALELNPTDEMILYKKAMFYQSIMQWNAALEAYADLHKVNAFHSDGHYNIGFIHMELELYDVASNNFSDAIYGNSEFHQAYYARGNCFETLGNIAQAEVDYKRAIEIKPDYIFAVDALRALDLRNKRFNK